MLTAICIVAFVGLNVALCRQTKRKEQDARRVLGGSRVLKTNNQGTR